MINKYTIVISVVLYVWILYTADDSVVTCYLRS